MYEELSNRELADVAESQAGDAPVDMDEVTKTLKDAAKLLRGSSNASSNLRFVVIGQLMMFAALRSDIRVQRPPRIELGEIIFLNRSWVPGAKFLKLVQEFSDVATRASKMPRGIGGLVQSIVEEADRRQHRAARSGR